RLRLRRTHHLRRIRNIHLDSGQTPEAKRRHVMIVERVEAAKASFFDGRGVVIALAAPVTETEAGRSFWWPPSSPRRPATGIDGPGNGNGGRQIGLAAAVQSTEAGNRHWCPVTETEAGRSF